MTINALSDTVKLNNGVDMPWLGLGVFQVDNGAEVESAVRDAVGIGYRSIDTAAAYGNETGVGRAIQVSGIPRDQLFITTKLDNADHGYEATIKACRTSLDKLGLSYLDLYLIHWPVKGKFLESWRAMQKLYEEGLVRAIGVSNFNVHHLEALIADSGFIPAVNQVELHPRLSQPELRSFCATHDIRVEAWSPLMKGRVLDHEKLVALAAKYGKTPSQIVLRWDLQHGVVTIPKSVRASRIKENADLFDFQLSPEDMAEIDALNRNERIGPDPDNFNF